MSTQISKNKLGKKLLVLWSLRVRSKKQCELCGKLGEVKDFDAHHIIRKTHEATRYDLNNGVCLCKGCHRFKVHMDTFTASRLIDKLKIRRGQKWHDDLEEKRKITKKHSREELECLMEELSK